MSLIYSNGFDVSKFDSNTVFVLDTNILYFVHSGYYLPTDQKSRCYSNIIQQLMMSGFSIYISTLSLQELLYGIENKEYKIYCRANNLNTDTFSKKQFRNIPTQRNRVKSKLEQVMNELSIYQLQDGCIKSEHINEFVSTYEVHKMDPMDFALTKNNDIEKCVFVTDDNDFSSINSLDVLTM